MRSIDSVSSRSFEALCGRQVPQIYRSMPRIEGPGEYTPIEFMIRLQDKTVELP